MGLEVYGGVVRNGGGDRVRAAFDSNGYIHIVYQDQTRSLIRHELFSPFSNTYQCQLNTIDAYTSAANNCGCGLPVVPNNLTGGQGVSSCLQSLMAPSITIARDQNPNVLTVPYESPGSGGDAEK